jgi:branched-chain amino acid transport system substrate-binding protein
VAHEVLSGIQASATDRAEQLRERGLSVEMAIHDDECESKQAAAIARRLTFETSPFVIGHLCSEATQAVLGFYARSKGLLICPASSSTELKFDAARGLFRSCPSVLGYARALAMRASNQYRSWPWMLIEEAGPVGSSMAGAYLLSMPTAPRGRIQIPAGKGIYLPFVGMDAGQSLVFYAGHHVGCITEVLRQLTQFQPEWRLMACEAGASIALLPGCEGRLSFATVVPAQHVPAPGSVPDRDAEDYRRAYVLLGRTAFDVLAAGLIGAKRAAPRLVSGSLLDNDVHTAMGSISFSAGGEASGYSFAITEL